MATRMQVTIDCADPGRLARFWATALGYRLEEPPDGFASWQEYWVSRGLPPEEVEDGYDSIVDPDGVGPRVWFQPVPEAKVVKNRVHLDLDVGRGRTGIRAIPSQAPLRKLQASPATLAAPSSRSRRMTCSRWRRPGASAGQ